MKKHIAFIMALAMMLSFAPAAFAQEEVRVISAPADSADYDGGYDDNGYYYQYDDYEGGYEDGHYYEYDDYDDDYYYSGQWYIDMYAPYLPQPYGVNICVGSEYIWFKGAGPVISQKDGSKLHAPAAQLLEAFGASVTRTDKEVDAYLKDGTLLRFTVGSTSVMRLPAQGKASYYTLQLAPYVAEDSGEIFVRLTDVAAIFGYSVNWNSYSRTAYVTDWSGIQKDIDSHFTGLDAMVKAAYKAQTRTGTFKSSEKLTITATMPGSSGFAPGSFSMTGEMLSNENALSGQYSTSLKLGDFRTMLEDFYGEEMDEMVSLIDGGKCELIMDMVQGILYVRTNRTNLLTEGEVQDDTWIKFEMPYYAEALAQTKELMGNFSVSAMVIEQVKAELEWDSLYNAFTSPAEMVEDIVVPLRVMMDDKYITVTGSGSDKTYTTTLTPKLLADRFVEFGYYTQEEAEDMIGYMGMGLDFDFTMSVSVRDGALSGSSMRGHFAYADSYSMPLPTVHKVTFDVTANANGGGKGVIKYLVNTQEVVVVNITGDVSKTTQQPLSQPPAGDKIYEAE